MKLVRFGAPGAEKPGLCDADGTIRDLSGQVKDITGDTLSPASLDKLRKLDPKTLPAAPKGVTFTAGKGQLRSLERGSHTRSKKNPGKRPHSG